MSVGGHTLVVREVAPPAVLDEIVDRKVTHAFFVPAVYGFFLDVPDVATRDYSALRCLGYGGSPMPLPLMRRCLATWDVDFSPDIGQRHLYTADGENNHVWTLRREGGQILGAFGRSGRHAGQFHYVHNLAVDSHGDIYTTEVDTGERVQKFVPGGAVGPGRARQ